MRPGRAVRTTLAAAVLALLAAAAPAATLTGRLQGAVVDVQGAPVPELEIRFIPMSEEGEAPRNLTTNKKGSFSHAFFPAGQYRVELADPSRALGSMTYIRRDASNLEVERAEGKAHPAQGAPPFRIAAGDRIELRIVLADPQVKKEQEQRAGLAQATGALKKANDLFVAGQFEQALAESDAVLASQPSMGTAHYLRGMILGRLGRHEETEASLRSALELAPEQAGVAAALGTALVQKGQLWKTEGRAEEAARAANEGLEFLEREIAKEPGSIPLLTNRVVALEIAGREDDLVPALDALVAADPSRISSHLRLARLHLSAGRTEQAVAALQRLPAEDPTAARDVYNMAAQLFNDGKAAEAITLAGRALEIDPGLAVVHRLLARAYLSQDQREKAVVELKKFLEMAPDDPEADTEREMLRQLEKARP